MQLTFSTVDGRTESLELMESLELAEVRGFVEAIFSVDGQFIALHVSGRALPESGTLKDAGVNDGDLVLVTDKRQLAQRPTAQPARAPQPAVATQSSNLSSGAVVRPGNRGAGPVFWDGMSVDDVLQHNQKPEHVVDILQQNPRILQELNFHNPKLAEQMRKDRATAISELRKFLMLNATASTVQKMAREQKDRDMERRLATNPMDEEANKYFGDKIREEQVQESYLNMMTNYPESLARVLMLYIEVEINGVALQAFVDSGAQSSVISAKCAERCNIDRLIDSRFAGQVVGVGTGRTLGRVHVAHIKIENNFFPISLTVMDDSQGLGDKNMEFLLGLDMLKRHRCSIDLEKGKLFFHGATGVVSTPFLHEKDLPESKGGTKDFNPNALPPSEDEGN